MTDGTILEDKEAISINNPTHGLVVDAIESAIGWVGIPTGNAYEMADIKTDLQKQTQTQQSPIIILNHSQANIVDKNSNRVSSGEIPLNNLYTYSFGSPEYAGTNQGAGNTLANSHNSVGSNYVQGFNNNLDPVSWSGLNPTFPYDNSKDALSAKHGIEEYKPWLQQKSVRDEIKSIFNQEIKK